ncbi:cytochrome b [Bosea sp. 685]|uniref:cytochrome b n=1 Tax=Bosea sp. 685 TaxID=3080057 RepID=UPI0028936B55|nr:cytochrome b/b6 domain-containing protein [Bosea sp. 685]WNJ92784.1 cytochrome b/b6 domain-containing protein [Bosea sp. 685]
MNAPVAGGGAEAFESIHIVAGQGPRTFPAISKSLHWLTAGLVLVMFATGVLMKQIGDGPLADAFYTFHKMAGASLLALVLLRLCYRVFTQLTGRWRRGAGSHVIHGILYAGLILTPLLGLAGISDYGARDVYFGLSLPLIWPEGAGYSDLLFRSHAWLAFGLIALVVAHVGIALGDFIQRGGARAALLPGKMTQPESASPSASNM